MPFAGFKDFKSCVAAQKKKGKSDESAHKICGYLKKKTEGMSQAELEKLTEADFDRMIAEMWFEEI